VNQQSDEPALMIWPRFRWLGEWWGARSLRARITIVTSALFAFAVVTGTVVLIIVLQQSLIRGIDSSAGKTAADIAAVVRRGDPPSTLLSSTGDYVQLLDADGAVVASSPGADATTAMLKPAALARVHGGGHLTIGGAWAGIDAPLRVTAVPVRGDTVLVATGLGRVEQSVHLLRNVALGGVPVAILVMALATYWIVGRTLRPVAALRLGAEEITAAGLADQRLPVADAQDEVQRLAVTLNAMLDRIDAATKRQRTFVGDAAHELRSPLASLRVQLEVAERVPPDDWNAVLRDSLVDVNRLELLVDDLLATARLDEAGGVLRRREMVELDVLVTRTVADYAQARVPVDARAAPMIVDGDPDGLRRVVVNLIDNAVRYARTGVSVAVVAGRHTAGQATVQLEVSDDGPGIPAHERQRVFDRFYRVSGSRSRESGGTGLGLPIVRDLVRAHGGTVRLADNQPGLRAIVTLPVAAESPRAGGDPPETPS
jgi:signal transduction histidine kinase